MDKILTIAIPTYNMEKYLEKCLSSLLIPENLDKLEVLIINDGSKDSSLEIARQFERAYPQTFRAIDKENGNYGSCVNRGLREATGKYFKVLDSDDSFATDNFNEFVKFLIDNDADLIMSDFVIQNLKDDSDEVVSYNLPVGVVFDFDYFAKKDVTYMWMHAVTHLTEKMRRINYVQQEGISYTDKEFVFYPMAVSKTVLYYPHIIYNYVMGRDGQTVDDTVWIRNYWMEVKAIMKLVDLYLQHKEDVSSGGCLFMQLQLKLYLTSIYYAFLKKYRKRVDYHKLKDFDDELKQKSLEVYSFVDDEKETAEFYYIRFWRKHQFTNVETYLLFRFLRRLCYYAQCKLFGNGK